MENYIRTLGMISALLTTSSFLPQAIKTWRTRSTDDLSPLMFTLFFIGILGWLFYGIFINDLPMILANSVTIVLAGIIMYFIIVGRKGNKIHHIGLYSDNPESLAGFYVNHFAASRGEVYKNPKKNFRSVFIQLGGGAKIEIMNWPIKKENAHPNGNTHISISTGSKELVDRMTEKFRNLGVTIIEEPRTTGDGYYESKIADPEGNVVELTI